jgi:hypothetical protein
MAILRDIKKDIEDSKTPETLATAAFMRQIQEQLQAARQEQKPVGVEDVAAVMTSIVGQAVPMDEKSAELFKQLAERMLSVE